METLETYIVPQDFDGAVEGIALKSSTDGVDRPFPNWSQTTEIRISAQFILVLSAFQVHTVGWSTRPGGLPGPWPQLRGCREWPWKAGGGCCLRNAR